MKFNRDGTIQLQNVSSDQMHLTKTQNDFIGTFNPLEKTGTIQIGSSNVVLLNWDILQIEVNDAFFNGQSYKTIYMSYPKGFI